MKKFIVVASVVVLLLVGLALFSFKETGLSGLSGKSAGGYNWKKVMSSKKVCKELENNGWEYKRMRGSHKIYEKNNKIVIVPKNKELPVGTLQSIKKMVNFAEKKNDEYHHFYI